VARSTRRRRRGTFAAFGRPVVGDPVFWLTALLAVAFGALVGGAVLLVVGLPDSGLGWAWPAALFLVAAWVAFKFLAMGINTSRALERTRQHADPARSASMQATGRAVGAAVGRGTAALTGRRRTATPSSAPQPSPPPTAATPPPPAAPSAAPSAAPTPTPSAPTTTDTAARVLGSMLGRRLADRRRDEDS
jgi:hypothetical protein